MTGVQAKIFFYCRLLPVRRINKSVLLDKSNLIIIKTAYALHNWLRTYRIQMDSPGLVDEEGCEIRAGNWRSTPTEGVETVTKKITNKYSREENEIRNIFPEIGWLY